MKKARYSFVALAMRFALAIAFSENSASCFRQRHRRAHDPRRFKSSETIKQTFTDDEYDRDWHHHSVPLLSLTTNCDTNTPTVSFAINKNGASGGFGDRLRGMVTTYYLAMMANSSFKVQWTQPYNLNDYFLVPSCRERVRTKHIDAVDGSDHNSNRESVQKIVRSSVDIWDYFADSLFVKDVGKDLEITTNSFHWKKIVRNEAFKDRAASLGLSDMSQAELFKLAIDDLLGNPTKIVRDSYTSVLRRLAGGYEPNKFGPSYIGVQIRLGGGAVTGWQDPSRHSMDDVQCFAKEAVRLCGLMHIRSIFVTADSEEAVQAFEEGVSKDFAASATSSLSPPIVVQVPGVIAHTDRSKVAENQSKDIWLKSILDWWLLKQASALVVSRSGFGETAAMASDASLALRLKLSSAEGSFVGVGGGGIQKCEFEDLLLGDRDVFQ